MSNTPSTGLSVDDLAGAIKAKYPDYAQTPNADLVDRIVQKYPDYAGHLTGSARLSLPSQKQAFLAKQEQPTQFEKDRTAGTAAPAWERMASGAWSGVKALAPSLPHSVSDAARELYSLTPIGAGENFAKTYLGERGSGQGVIPSVGSALAGNVGLDAQGIKERAQKGDIAGVVGEGIPAIAGALLPSVGEAGGAARERIGAAIHTPEGELKPIARDVARGGAFGAGALAGRAVGLPGIGDWIAGHAAEEVGPRVMEKVFPEPEGARTARAIRNAPAAMPELGNLGNPGWFAKLPDRMPEAKTVEPELGTPENPGWVAKLPDRMPTPKETAALKQSSAMDRLGPQIEQAAGWKPLPPNQPIYQRPQAVGADVLPHLEENPAQGPRSAMQQWPPLSQTPEIGGEKMVRPELKPEVVPQIIPEEVGRQYGAGPLEMNKPLREQVALNPNAPPSRQVELEKKYPDKAVRQMVHANGEEMAQAAGGNAELMRAVHDLTNPDVRNALINSGEDMGQRMVNNRKASGDMSRQEAFRKLLAKGLTPQQIVDLAKKPIAEPSAKSGPKSWRPLNARKESASD